MADDQSEDHDGPDPLINEVPHEHHVFLLEPVGADSWHLIHTLSQERVSLPAPAGKWVLVFGDDGFGSISDTEASNVMLLEDLFTKMVSEDDVGERFLHQMVNGTACKWSLTDEQAVHTHVLVTAAVGPTRAEHDVEAYTLKMPCHGGYRILWAMKGFFEIMQVKGFLNEPSKWAYDSMKSWARHVEPMLQGRQVFHSTSSPKRSESGGEWADAFLPHVASSTLVLLGQLTRWCQPCNRLGGLKDANSRDAAALFLKSLLCETMSGRTCAFKVKLEAGQFQSPYPLRFDGEYVLECTNGMVDLRVLQAAVANKRTCPCILLAWWTGLKLADVGSRVPVSTLLKRALCNPGTSKSMYPQVLLQAALEVERGLELRLAGDEGAPSIGCRLYSIWDTMDNPDALNSVLLKHVLGGVRESSFHRSTSLASDKANVNGLNLDMGLLVWPSNKCALACCQAPLNF